MRTLTEAQTIPNEMDVLTERVAALHKRVIETNKTLNDTADRLWGSEAQCGQAGDESPTPNGLIEQMQIALSIFERDIMATQAAANRLARL
jgi:hypothetical protein